MNRSEFLAGAGSLLVASVAPATSPATLPDDAAAVQQLIIDDYHAFYVLQDPVRYRALLTDDYLLLENGEVLNLAGDLALMPKIEDEYRRIDRFAFHQVRHSGDVGWAVYTLRSEITDRRNGFRKREFQESAVCRRIGGSWKVALLHSTRVQAPAK